MTWVIVATAVWGAISLLWTLAVARRLGCPPYDAPALPAGLVLEATRTTRVNGT